MSSTTNNLWDLTNIGLDRIPDARVVLFDNKSDSKSSYQYYTDSEKRLKSTGTIQTLLGLSKLMYNSLKIVSPNLYFAPDFPDYLLPEDDPKYSKGSNAYLDLSEIKNMPHYRDDLYSRNFDDYDKLDNVPRPTITWGVVRSEPGSAGGEPFQGTREVKPRHRQMVAVFSPELRKYVGELNKINYIKQYGGLTHWVDIKGQVFDNLIQFNMWARSSWEVEELTEWFIDYMRTYTGMFREAGIIEMWPDRRVRDDTTNQIKNMYHSRSLLYYIRTEKLDIRNINPIKRVDANIYIDSDIGSKNSTDSDEYVVDDNHDKLLNKYHPK